MSSRTKVSIGLLRPVSYTHLDVYKRQTLALILLGIAALPVGLPLVLVLAVLIFVAVVVGVCLLFALGCVLLAGFIAVCSLVYAGFKMLTVSLASGLMSIGLGLIGISGVVLIATAAIYLFIKLKPIVINGFANLYNRLKGDKAVSYTHLLQCHRAVQFFSSRVLKCCSFLRAA